MTGPSPSAFSVRDARKEDVPAIVDTLTRAFFDDPQFAWVMPAERSRATRLRRFFDTLLRVEAFGAATVEVVGAGGKIAGAAVWFPPGGWPPTVSHQLRALPGYVRAFGKRVPAASRLVSTAARMHPHGGYWYLACVGVDPAEQGRGVGAALLRARLQVCDEAQTQAFLEASKQTNVPLYEHFGFVALDVLKLGPGAPVVTPMLRAPHAPRTRWS